MGWRDLCYEISDLTILSHRSVIFGLLSSRFDRAKVFAMFLMMSCCDMFDLTILESSISIIWDTSRFLVENQWVL